MATKSLKTRIQNKHDTEANWAKATTFRPLAGELIIYDADSNNAKPRFKIGDGSRTINNLPFVAIDYDSRITSIENTVDGLGTAAQKDVGFFATAAQGTKADNAVPNTRKVNNKVLSTDIRLEPSDVGVTESDFPGLKKTGTITGITMNGASKGTSGVVDLGTVITAHQDISGKQDKITSTKKLPASLVSGLATVATSGSYNDLSNKPTVHDVTYTKLVGSVDFTLTAYTDAPYFDDQNAATWEYNSVIGGKALTSTTDIGLLIGNDYTLGVNLQGTTTLFRATAEDGSSYGWPGVKILWFKRENITTQFFIYDHCTIVGENIEAGNGCIFVADLSSDITIADIAGFGGERGILNPVTISNSAIKINSAVTMYINTDNVINGTKTDGSITLTANNKGSVDYELEIFATTTEGLFEIINKYKLTESTISNWGFTKNVGTVTAVVVNGYHYDPEGGTVDLGTVLTSHQNIRTLNTNNNTSQTVSASESISGSGTINLHKVAKTGSYNDLLNTPAAVTESTVSGWGFTKNTGTITGIKMNDASKGTSGVVDLGTVLTDASKFATSAQGTKADNALSLDGGTIKKSKTIKMDASANSDGANLKWGTVNHKNPYIGYASDQVDGTFVVGSLLGTNYASGLAIGGGSGNLLWKGTKVATTSDIPNISGKLDKSAFSLSGTTLTITI